MMPTLRGAVRGLLHRRGVEVERLDDDTWLVRKPTGLTARRIGPPDLRLHVLRDEETVRRTMNRYQNRLGAHLGAEHLQWMVRKLHIDCVLDVGANTGQFASGLRHRGYTGRIVSFEPVPDVAAELRRHAADDPDWHVYEHALGAEEGEVSINVVPGTMSSLLPASEFGKEWSETLTESTSVPIRIRRLDAVFDEVIAGLEGPRVFLKLDTQGHDLAAMRGAGPCLDRVLGMQSEVACLPIYDGMPTMTEALSAFEDAGFAVSGIFPVTRHAQSLRAIEFDVLLVRDTHGP